MNLYGFAGGDPVTYSDPFGLSECTKEELQAGHETVTNKGGAACVERRQRLSDEETACVGAVIGFEARIAMDATSVAGYTAAAKVAGRIVAREAISGLKLLQASAGTLRGASAGKVKRDAAKVGALNTLEVQLMAGSAGVAGVDRVFEPQESGTFLENLIPFRSIGNDWSNVKRSCSPR